MKFEEELSKELKKPLTFEKKDVKTDVRMNRYITALVKKDGELIGKGIGTVCAFSSLLYAAAKSIQLKSEIEVVKE
jgi:hypothetical protein